MAQTVLHYCSGLPKKEFDPGAVILTEGGQDKVLHILVEGAVEIRKGDTQVNVQSEPGSIFGELAILLEVPHTATVKAVTPVRTVMVEQGSAFLRSHPDITFYLAQSLAKKLHSITSYLVDLKNQYEDRSDHLGMVDQVLETLLHQQDEEHTIGSARYPDTTI